MFTTIAEVRAANKAIGNCWFSRDSMRFFNSRIESNLIRGKYFIYSEQRGEYTPRLYSIREVDEHGRISTVGKFQDYLSKEDAREAIRRLP